MRQNGTVLRLFAVTMVRPSDASATAHTGPDSALTPP